MKSILKKLAFAGFVIVAGASVAGAAPNAPVADVCALIGSMQGVFKTLRTLAFVGAAFCIAGWGWGFIAAGEAKMDDLKKRGIGLLVGFTLLFGIAVVLQFLPGISGCAGAGWN
ncbi:MAG: hypothetical protein LBJ18_01670 [Rickettsiales bacterium]|jgi:hypothetical protein|nr:hypothetical protein [Rickettsiales bacterium]